MITPDKFTTLDESILGIVPYVMSISSDSIRVIDLYYKLNSQINDPDKFILLLDTLYILNLINIDTETGTVHFANRN